MVYRPAMTNQPQDGGAEEWIRALYPEILRYCMFHTPSRSEAEDAVQDTFLKALRHGFGGGSRRAFLYTIARNTCIDMARRKRPGELPEGLAAGDDGLLNAEADADLALLLCGLSAELYEPVLLRFQQGLTLREIADVLDIPLRTAQSRLRAALKRIKNKLEKEGGAHAL